jgi:hypothetical protein
MDIERGNLPSASAIDRYDACRGAYLLSRGKPDIKTPEMQAMADAGDRIHAWLEDKDLIDLIPEELEVAQWCDEQRQVLITKVFGDNMTWFFSEQRMWMFDPLTGRQIASGKADDIRIYSHTALITDFKTGRGEQRESPKNRQLRTLAVILNEDPRGRSLEEIYVAIIQPLITSTPLMTKYTAVDLGKARIELQDLLRDIQRPDAPRTAGEWCKFCPAKFNCPEAESMVKKFIQVDVPSKEGKELADLLNIVSGAKAIITAVEARAKQLIRENPNSIPGWGLSKDSEVRSIRDPFGAYKVLNEAGHITREQFLSDCVYTGVGDLQKALVKFAGMTPADAKRTVNSVCSKFITKTPKSGSLEKREQ